MYFTYVLLSQKIKRTYIGSTKDIKKRLMQHNSGNTKSTKKFKPYKILFIERFETKTEGEKRERYWKSGAGRRKLKKYFNDNNLN